MIQSPFSGMNAIITGAGTGVGAATALALARKGANVLINYRSSSESAKVVCDQCLQLGVDAFELQGDVSKEDDCIYLVSSAIKRWGTLDLLVNCAGITQFVPMEQLDKLNVQDFLNIYQVNTLGPFLMARASSKHMRLGSAIVSVSSLSAQTGQGSSIPYVLSKAALNALTLSLARVLSPGIRVNAVMPGMIEGRWLLNGLGDEQYQRVKQSFTETSLLGKICSSEEIANSLLWLLDPSCIMTGQVVTVDAGFSLGKPPTPSVSKRQ